jgi:hypothetical protein
MARPSETAPGYGEDVFGLQGPDEGDIIVNGTSGKKIKRAHRFHH